MITDMIRKVTNRIAQLSKALETSFRKLRSASDRARWETEANLSQSWDSRTEQIARLIDGGTSVIEFGAGRRVLKSCLPNDCRYTPSDLFDRGFGTIICDLNSSVLPQFGPYDVAVFSGVLEYVNDVSRLIMHLSKFVDTIVASYAIVETSRFDRRQAGWVNDFSSDALIAVFESAGFECDHIERWQSQAIYRFRKRIRVY